jgi:ATP diphosphatase
LIRRHPHVFAGASKPLSAKEQTQAWDAIKAQEKKPKDTRNTFADIPASLPPILKQKKYKKKLAKKVLIGKKALMLSKKLRKS